MSFILAKVKPKNALAVILFLQFVVYATVFFNVPVLRQVLGFLYLTFAPGIIILKLLGLDKLDRLEIGLFSVGFSIAFLMMAGLLINEFGFLLGVSEPLSLIPLVIILNSLILAGGFIASLKSNSIKFWAVNHFTLHPLALLLISLPILSFAGAMYVNAFNNNSTLLFMMILISLLFVIGVVSTKLLPPKLYPFAVLMIAISLLFHSSLISNYIVSFGSDVPLEYFVFKTTENNAHWSSTPPFFWDALYGRINAMLSVTVLPTIYSTLLNVDPAWVFKILIPLIFSFVPLGLYQVWKKFVGEKYALISAFLFMAQSTFYTEMLGLNRQMIAELFFVLLLLVILNANMKPANKVMCFMIFSVALITSHYALAEIFLFFIAFSLISLIALKKPSRSITVTLVVFFLTVMLTWYIFISGSAVFDSFLSFGDYVYKQMGDFLNPASRGQDVLRGLGMESAPSVWNAISRAFAYFTQALIVVGFVGVVTRRTRIHLQNEYFMFSVAAMTLLGLLIGVPGLANTFNMTRFYHVLLFWLAPFCVLGAEVTFKLVFKQEKKHEASLLLIIVLVPYFLFQTGLVYELAGAESWSLSLSGYRMGGFQLYRSFGYISGQDVLSAQWMSRNVDFKKIQVFADLSSRNNVLSSYSLLYMGYVNVLSNATEVPADGIVYLSRLNIIEGKVVGIRKTWNISGVYPLLDGVNMIYSNGASEIYLGSSG